MAKLLLRRILRLVGATATGAGLVPLASSHHVFAHQLLIEALPMVIPDMVYSPQLQLMVKPETENPFSAILEVCSGANQMGSTRLRRWSPR